MGSNIFLKNVNTHLVRFLKFCLCWFLFDVKTALELVKCQISHSTVNKMANLLQKFSGILQKPKLHR